MPVEAPFKPAFGAAAAALIKRHGNAFASEEGPNDPGAVSGARFIPHFREIEHRSQQVGSITQ